MLATPLVVGSPLETMSCNLGCKKVCCDEKGGAVCMKACGCSNDSCVDKPSLEDLAQPKKRQGSGITVYADNNCKVDVVRCTYKISSALGEMVDLGFAINGVYTECLTAGREGQCVTEISNIAYNTGGTVKDISLAYGLCGGAGVGIDDACAAEIGDAMKWLGGAAADLSEGAISCTDVANITN